MKADSWWWWGGNLNFFPFFFEETLGSSRGPEPRGQICRNCLGSACAGLSGEPGRAASGSVPSLVNPISHCFHEGLLWFLIKHEKKDMREKRKRQLAGARLQCLRVGTAPGLWKTCALAGR